MNDPLLNAARLKLGRCYNDRAAASFRHDDLVREIEDAFGPGKDRVEALAAEEARFIKERAAIQAQLEAVEAEVEGLQGNSANGAEQLRHLSQLRVAASFRHDDLKREIEDRHEAGETRDKALKAEDDRFLKERAAIQKKIDALNDRAGVRAAA